MKRILRKMTSICIAIAVVTAMGITSLAVENIDGNGNVIGDKDPATALTTSLIIEKELTGYNPETTEVYAPNVTYTYAIAGIDAQKVITDVDGVKATTKPGPAGATITQTISWTSTEMIDVSPTGTPNRKDITIDLSNVSFSGEGLGAGVYRYQITETCTNKAAVGVTDGDIAEVRYLDVYVRDAKANEEPGYKIYGYVLFENNNNIDGSQDAQTDTVDEAVKTEGFVQTDDLTADSYYTYNVTVTKDLVNDSINEGHGFPFEFVFTKDTNVTGSFNLVASYTTDPVAMDDVTTTIAHENSVTYEGIPCGTRVDIIETNDIATAAYYVTTDGADDNVTDLLVNYNETTGDTDVSINTTAVDTPADANFDVTFTNTLALISPTGVALAVVPFVILLGFGVGLMVVCTTKRKEDQA